MFCNLYFYLFKVIAFSSVVFIFMYFTPPQFTKWGGSKIHKKKYHWTRGDHFKQIEIQVTKHFELLCLVLEQFKIFLPSGPPGSLSEFRTNSAADICKPMFVKVTLSCCCIMPVQLLILQLCQCWSQLVFNRPKCSCFPSFCVPLHWLLVAARIQFRRFVHGTPFSTTNPTSLPSPLDQLTHDICSSLP